MTSLDMGRSACQQNKGAMGERIGVVTFRGERFFSRSDRPDQTTVEVLGKVHSKRYYLVAFSSEIHVVKRESKLTITSRNPRTRKEETFTGHVTRGLTFNPTKPLGPTDEAMLLELADLQAKGVTVELLQEMCLSAHSGTVGRLYIAYEQAQVSTITGGRIEPLVESITRS
ncbi:hypothetical protein HY988_04105 [Candidatus Micrarchaeota archaeon]|nr:hypothetical protein [Candidatus Micrarchaeota archaeon]